MKIKKYIKMLIFEPRRFLYALFLRVGRIGTWNFMTDARYLKILYYLSMGKKLNLDNPETYNEKLQWIKIHDRKPEYVGMVDKYEVKEYVANIIGKEHIIPTLGVWNSFSEIKFDMLPKQFVLKCTHDSGSVVICTDKDKFNVNSAKKIINKAMKRNLFWYGREWPYKNVKPRIIAEKYMVDESGTELKDYKFFCFDGMVKAMFVAKDRYTEGEETKFDFFDENFNHMPLVNGHPNATVEISCPQSFEEMKQMAAKLSKGIPHLRVDFYDINGTVYFGELTFFHYSGIVPFQPEKWDYEFGSWIKLPKQVI